MTNVRPLAKWVHRYGKRAAITIVGVVLVLVGLVLLVLPGPGLLVIAAGLAVLATEYSWAHSALEAVKRQLKAARERVRQGRSQE